jgi:hypothetical protein
MVASSTLLSQRFHDNLNEAVHKDFSRKGAKTQRKTFGFRVFLCVFAPLREKSFLGWRRRGR